MTVYDSAGSTPFGRPPVRAVTLWAGGAAAALVAAGVAVVGFLLVRGVFDLPILGVERGGAVFEPSMLTYALLAGLGAVLATALMHLLLLTTPRPRTFFGWIIGLATAAAMIVPFTLDQPWPAKLATAGLNFFIGLVTGVLVSMSARSAVRPGRRTSSTDLPIRDA
jgi:hypothetical protein